jgi:hypothetical protein
LRFASPPQRAAAVEAACREPATNLSEPQSLRLEGSQRTAPTSQKRSIGIESERRLNNPTRYAEVEDNIAAVPLQIEEFASRLFNEPLMPIGSDSIRAEQFRSATAVASQGSIIGITINNEKVARAIGIKPIIRETHQVNGSDLAIYFHH